MEACSGADRDHCRVRQPMSNLEGRKGIERIKTGHADTMIMIEVNNFCTTVAQRLCGA